MRKVSMVILMVLVGISLLVSNLLADSTRTITRKTYCAVSGATVVSTQGATIYRVGGSASASSAYFAILDASSVPGTIVASTVKVEAGEATQYQTLPLIDFGDEGLVCNSGIVVFSTGMNVVIEYN